MSVQDMLVIDLISLSPDGDGATLYAVDNRPLRDLDQQLFEIDSKLGAYLMALDTGQVEEVSGRLVSLALVVPNEPRTPRARRLLELIHEQCLAKGLGFSVHVQRLPDEYARLLGLTDEERRPFDPRQDDSAAYPVTRDELSETNMASVLEHQPELRSWLDRQAPERSGESLPARFKRVLGGRG